VRIGRRGFLLLSAGAMASRSTPSRAAAPDDLRTVGFLMGLANDAESRRRVKAFEQGLLKEGWAPRRDIRIRYHFAAGDADRMRDYARELVASKPDVLVGHSTPVVRELVQATKTIPIVFVVVADPVGSGFAASIPHPGGNATGFTNLDASITGKLLTILKQITPKLDRVALMYNPDTVAGEGLFYLHPFEAAAPAFSVQPAAAQVRTADDIKSTMAALGQDEGGGLIVMPDNFTTVHRQLIIALAEQFRIPAIYPYRYFAEAGGLMSYGVDVLDLFRRAPEYVVRILRGEKPGDLPVQSPTKFELAINLSTAKSLGLTVPKILLASADSLIN
jgi:putative ABC transport system substrate-binding protein